MKFQNDNNAFEIQKYTPNTKINLSSEIPYSRKTKNSLPLTLKGMVSPNSPPVLPDDDVSSAAADCCSTGVELRDGAVMLVIRGLPLLPPPTDLELPLLPLPPDFVPAGPPDLKFPVLLPDFEEPLFPVLTPPAALPDFALPVTFQGLPLPTLPLR
jgi:hypothetical protein